MTTRTVTVRIGFGTYVEPDSSYEHVTIEVQGDGSDSIHDVKAKIAAAVGGSVTPDDLLLYFNTNEQRMGRQYQRDPSVNEKELRLGQFNVLPWLQRFPHWHLSATLLPDAPPPPGGWVGGQAVHVGTAGAGQQPAAEPRALLALPSLPVHRLWLQKPPTTLLLCGPPRGSAASLVRLLEQGLPCNRPWLCSACRRGHPACGSGGGEEGPRCCRQGAC